MKLTTKHSKSKNVLKIRTLNKKQFKQLDFTNTGFENKKGQMIVHNGILYVSTTDTKTPDDWRDLGQQLTQKIKSTKATHASMIVPDKILQFAEGLLLADYNFDNYKSKKDETKEVTLQLINPSEDLKPVIKEAKARIAAQFLTRDWVNTTPEDAHADSIEKAVRKMFKGTDIEVDVYGEKHLEKLNMNGHLAVNRASRHKAKTIKLTYKPTIMQWMSTTKKPKHHVFVGKGLTYDSGGLSIKPGSSMTNMKSDKAGAMTLIGLMDYLSKQGCPHKVTAYIALAENMIDGTAYKPDDVLTMKNGKTVHVKNTDAEGRLVLFDNLVLAEEENKKATTIHSLATLTGAAVYQFDGACGLVGFNDKLKEQVIASGKKADEIYMNAEFHKNMMKGVDDELADLSNTGTANMGCQKAGLFLTNALTEKAKKKYVHHDIAGPAFVKGFGTGFGVRTLIEFLKN